MKLKPFFSYFGSKYTVAPYYPKPRFRRIVEPFAGSAGYSLRYPSYNVCLYELNEKVYGVWNYLIKASIREILSLPIDVNHVDDILGCQEAKYLVGFWLNEATTSPRKSRSRNGRWGNTIRSRIAAQLEYIRHWTVLNKSYEKADKSEATWFVDPPYQESGKNYSCKLSNYDSLSKWCRELRGQVIVCEQGGATWLPFVPFGTIRAAASTGAARYSEEVIWCSDWQ